jgi:Fe-S cluster assembly protein SufD
MTATMAPAFPSARDEAWRYTPVDEILAALDGAVPATAALVPRSVVDELAGSHGGVRLVFVNGALAAAVSDHDGLPAGVSYGRAPTVAPPGDGSDGFEALAHAAGQDVASVLVAAGVDVPVPIHVVHVVVPGVERTVTHPRTVVEVGAGSRVSVVETYCGLPGPALTNASTTIRLGPAATVDHTRVQSETGEAVHVGRTVVEQAERSTAHVTSVMIGADIARNALEVRLRGPGARAELDGVYLPTGRQRHDNVVTADHAADHGTSVQRFTGVVDGHARGSFSGRVLVRPGTVGTDARQSNPNLLLTRTAEADTRPWLEILADDVRCTHGATVGRLDEDALFYLRSRGIPETEGRTMLVDAFVRDITDAIPHPSLRDHVASLIGARR